MNKFPIFALVEGKVEKVAGASSLLSAQEIIEELREEGYECLAIGFTEEKTDE